MVMGDVRVGSLAPSHSTPLPASQSRPHVLALLLRRSVDALSSPLLSSPLLSSPLLSSPLLSSPLLPFSLITQRASRPLTAHTATLIALSVKGIDVSWTQHPLPLSQLLTRRDRRVVPSSH